MVECETCGKGFQFQSQLTEHRRVHQLIGDWVCFRPACGKRFKRESELDAHLFKHRTMYVHIRENTKTKKVSFANDVVKHSHG